MALVVLGVLILLPILAVLYLMSGSTGDIDLGSIATMVPIIGVMVALIGVAFVVKRRG
jgi:hypothetical protein